MVQHHANLHHGGIHNRKGKQFSVVLVTSLVLNSILSLALVCSVLYPSGRCQNDTTHGDDSDLRRIPITFNGGHPTDTMTGSCYCSDGRSLGATSSTNDYCMCNPSLAIDLVIMSGPENEHVWVVRRQDTDQLAVMGGFVQIGESVTDAVTRELHEETGLVLSTAPASQPQLFGMYSDPRRDNRRHTVSAVYAVHLDGTEKPVASDDAKGVHRIPVSEISSHEFFADHKTILLDYLKLLRGPTASDEFTLSLGDFASDISRSVCTPLKFDQLKELRT